MIFINKEFTKEFLSYYLSTIFTEFLSKKLIRFNSVISQIDFVRVSKIFNQKYLEKLILLKPDVIQNEIEYIFENLQEVKEFYLPKQYFYGVKLPYFRYSTFDFRNKVDPLLFDSHIDLYITELKTLNLKSYNIDWAINSLSNIKAQVEAKNIVKKLESIILGKSKIEEIFPLWVHELSNLFSYSRLSKDLTYKLVSFLDITICPYCNEDKLHFYLSPEGDKDYRPSLDHFYPKSKFPFLALSVYNLIPSCEFCNENCKGSIDTHSFPFASPHITGVDEEPLFTFDTGYLKEQFDRLTVDNITIKLNSMNQSIDNNVDMFAIENRYNNDDYKLWFMKFIKTKHTIEDLKFPKEHSPFLESLVGRNLNQGIPATKAENKKFSLDMFNQVLDRKVKLDD